MTRWDALPSAVIEYILSLRTRMIRELRAQLELRRLAAEHLRFHNRVMRPLQSYPTIKRSEHLVTQTTQSPKQT